MKSKEKTFDERGVAAYKSLKVYRYFADGYVQNLWAGEPLEHGAAVVVRCHCFSSLKVKKVCVVQFVGRSASGVTLWPETSQSVGC